MRNDEPTSADAIVVMSMSPGNDPSGPKFGSSEIDGVSGAAAAPATEGAELDGADATTALEGTQGVSEGVSGPDAAMAERIAAGELDPQQAAAQLIDQVVRAQMPEGSLEQIEQLKGELALLLADDPTLAALLRR